MQIIVRNDTPSPVVLFTVDSMSKQEKKEGVVRPGVENSFYVPGLVPFEFRIKDLNTETTIMSEHIASNSS